MSHLMQLDKQIQSVKKTQKITHAMRLIAMSLYVRIEKTQVAAKNYHRKYQDFLDILTKQNPTWKNPITQIDDPFNQRPVIILMSSIKGLCGGFNDAMLSYFDRFIEISQYQQPFFFTIGKRATDHIERFIKRTAQGTIVKAYHEVSSHALQSIIQDLTHTILSLSPRYSSILMYSTQFQNFFMQHATHTYIIKPYEHQKNSYITPEKRKKQEAEENSFALDMIWEHNPNDILTVLGTCFLHATLTPLIIDSLASEQASRFLAMEHATSNAEKYVERLELEYNKLRQESITKELSEITSIMSKSSDRE